MRVDRWSTAWPSADAGWSPTHPGGPGRFRMRAGHQCRNDGTHVDDVRATPSGSAFQDLRNRRTQMPSTIARQVVSICPGAAVFTSAPADTLPQVAAPMRNRGLAGFVSGQLLAGPTSDTVFSWASTAWIWLRRQVSRSRGGRASGCEDAGSAVATEADRVSVLPHSARQFLRRGFRPGPFLLPESKPQATGS